MTVEITIGVHAVEKQWGCRIYSKVRYSEMNHNSGLRKRLNTTEAISEVQVGRESSLDHPDRITMEQHHEVGKA